MKYDIESIKKRKNNTKIIKRILDVILIILIYHIVLLAISYINKMENISFFGYKAYIITTNSMEPTIKKESVIIVKKCNESDLKENDIITFKQGQEIITHRIIKVENTDYGKQYITKGDNNNTEDLEKVKYNTIEGKQILTIPNLGKLINALEDSIILLIIALVLLILCFYKILVQEKRDNRREKKRFEDEKSSRN